MLDDNYSNDQLTELKMKSLIKQPMFNIGYSNGMVNEWIYDTLQLLKFTLLNLPACNTFTFSIGITSETTDYTIHVPRFVSNYEASILCDVIVEFLQGNKFKRIITYDALGTTIITVLSNTESVKVQEIKEMLKRHIAIFSEGNCHTEHVGSYDFYNTFLYKKPMDRYVRYEVAAELCKMYDVITSFINAEN